MPRARGKKAAKGKPSAVVDGQSTGEMSKEQLEEHIVRLREELEREREERSYFQLERDKIQGFWEIARRNLEEVRAQLRNGTREREEAEERHRVEITVYKQKLKHVLSEQHHAVSGLKMDGAASIALIQNQNMESELQLHRDKQDLEGALREKATHRESCIKELKLKHQVELMQQANEYDSKIREMEVKYHSRMQSLVEEWSRRREEEGSVLEDRLKSRVQSLVQEHESARRQEEPPRYYKRQPPACEFKELMVTQQRAIQEDNELSAAQKEISRLHERLQEAELQLPLLHQRLQDYETDKAETVKRKAHLKQLEAEFTHLRLEQQLLLTAFSQVQQERDELLRLQLKAQQEVEQRRGLKEALLQRKLEAMTQTLQRREAQLFTNTEDAGTNTLQDMLESKHVSITELQPELGRNTQEYDHLTLTCRDRLTALGVPLSHCPLRPSHHILGGRPQGQRPPGPTTRR